MQQVLDFSDVDLLQHVYEEALQVLTAANVLVVGAAGGDFHLN